MKAMRYCEKCRRIFEDATCPACGRSGRQIEPDDICFLIEKKAIWAGMLADVLRQEDIPFLQEGVKGAYLTAKDGYMLERKRFYVAYEDLPKAQEIVEELFGNSDE